MVIGFSNFIRLFPTAGTSQCQKTVTYSNAAKYQLNIFSLILFISAPNGTLLSGKGKIYRIKKLKKKRKLIFRAFVQFGFVPVVVSMKIILTLKYAFFIIQW